MRVDFDLDAFAQYRCIRILTYSSSVQVLHTVLERFAESRVECVLGYSRVVNNVASIIALQTAAIEEVHSVLRGLPASSRDDILKRVQEALRHHAALEFGSQARRIEGQELAVFEVRAGCIVAACFHPGDTDDDEAFWGEGQRDSSRATDQ